MSTPSHISAERDGCVLCYVLGYALYFVAIFIGFPHKSRYGDPGLVVSVMLVAIGSVFVSQTALMHFVKRSRGFREGFNALLLVFIPSFAASLSSGFLISQWGDSKIMIDSPLIAVLFTVVLVLSALTTLFYSAISVNLMSSLIYDKRAA